MFLKNSEENIEKNPIILQDIFINIKMFILKKFSCIKKYEYKLKIII